jgi:hypothetical protein
MMMDLPSAFMLQQALPVQTLHREGAFMKSVMAFVIGASVLLPAQAFAIANPQSAPTPNIVTPLSDR